MEHETTTNPDLHGAESYGAVIRLALPAMAGMLFHNIMHLMDTFWVGKLGTEEVAAVATAGSVWWVLMTFITLVQTGTMALVARASGRGDKREVVRTSRVSLMLAAGIGLMIGLPGLLATSTVMGLFGLEPQVFLFAEAYMGIIFIGLPLFFLTMVSTTIFQASGDTLTPMWILGIINVANIILDPLLIFGIGFFPEMDVRGAAVATVLSNLLGTILFFRLLSSRGLLEGNGPEGNADIIRRILKIGWPASLRGLARPLSGTVLFRVVAFYGTAALAGFGIGMRCFSLMFIYLFGLNIAASTLTGQFLGASRPEGARTAVGRTLFLGLGIQGVFSTVFIIFAPLIIAIFNDSPGVVSMGTGYLRVISVGMILSIPAFSIAGAFFGSGNTGPPMVFSMIANWLLKIPIGVVSTFVFEWSIYGIWWAIFFSMVFESAMLMIWYRRGKWAEKEV